MNVIRNQDMSAGKLTYPGVQGIEESQKEIARLHRTSLEILDPLGTSAGPLVELWIRAARENRLPSEQVLDAARAAASKRGGRAPRPGVCPHESTARRRLRSSRFRTPKSFASHSPPVSTTNRGSIRRSGTWPRKIWT